MWKVSIASINQYLADESHDGLWYGHADMNTGKRAATEFGALDAFFPAVLALSGDQARAQKLLDSCYKMWTAYGIEPESFDYSTMKAIDSQLRVAAGDHRVHVLPVFLHRRLADTCRWDRPITTPW